MSFPSDPLAAPRAARRAAATGGSLIVLSSLAFAQGPVFQTPGMPSFGSQYPAGPAGGEEGESQTSRFSSVFNPSFSFVVDALADYVDSDSERDGFDAELRALEFSAQSWVDPDAWAYFIAAADEESVSVEEAAIHYVGLGGNWTLRAGRFFVDFGKQMQTHVHELRTIERPLVLRTYLGDEVKGDGLQVDHWFAVGDETAVRWSLGVFADLLPEAEDEDDGDPAAEASVADRKSLGDLNYTARVTGFRDAGDNGVAQLGLSARAIPDYSFEFEPSGASEGGLASFVWGLDATYGWKDDAGLARWTLGGEYLRSTGDTGSALDDAGTPGDPSDDAVLVLDEDVGGWYAYADYGWNPYNSVGLQYSLAELPDGDDLQEVEAYYTRMFSEYHRLRFAVAALDSDVEDEDSLRFAVQYTAVLGAHGHGVNW